MNKTKLMWTKEAWQDYNYWAKNDLKKVKRINELIKNMFNDPYKGKGKPEKLKYLDGCWSRRIDIEHRLVYKASHDALYILQCRYHYD